MSLIIGLLFICYSVLALIGHIMKIKGVKNLYYTGWLKNNSGKMRLVYYLLVSAVLIALGVSLVYFQLEINSPFSANSF